jgi:hypothetical protein
MDPKGAFSHVFELRFFRTAFQMAKQEAASPCASSERVRIKVELRCPKCKQIGSAIWEENSAPSPNGPEPVLFSVSDGFYQRMTNNHRDLQTRCVKCDAIVD